MKHLGQIISERVYRHFKRLCEVRYIDTKSEKYRGRVYKKNPFDVYNQEPIKNNEKIRVYHGCSLKTAVDWAINGTSGRVYHPRKYSYESGMNPLGVFVTVDFEKAKGFGDDYECPCVVEFTASASDLESPVWNGSDSYFVQGSNPQPFKDKQERDAQKQKYDADARSIKDDTYWDYRKNKEVKISYDHIRNSDKPAMAMNIFNNYEHQALFMGNLNPNQIKRIWINPKDEKTGYVSTEKSYIPLTVREFLKRYRDKEFSVEGSYGKKQRIQRNKYYLPNEDFKGFDDFFDRLGKEHGWEFTKKEREDNLRNIMQYDHYKETVTNHMWPRQIIQAFGQDFFDEYFNRFGQ